MLKSSFERSLDAKNRLRIPTSFKDSLGDNPCISINNDGGLVIYPSSTIDTISNILKDMTIPIEDRDAVRMFLSQMYDIEEDTQGRFTLNSTLREFSGITKDLIFSGFNDRIEIWEPTLFNAKMAAEAAKKRDMSKYGIY